MSSNHIKLRKLSADTDIPIAVLRKIIDGTFIPQEPRFLSSKPFTLADQIENARLESLGQLTSNPILDDEDEYHTPEKTPLEKLALLTEPADLYYLLTDLEFNDVAFIPTYNKLIEAIQAALSENPDLEELENLEGYSPSGSPQEATILGLIEKQQLDEVKQTEDFDELVNLYENNTYPLKVKRVLVEKIISTCSSTEESERLIDEVFADETFEYYRALKRHHELAVTIIKQLTSADDAGGIAETLDNGSDEMVVLAKRITELEAGSAENIWYYEDLFPDNSEALEELALGAMAHITTYSEENDELLEEISKSFSEASRLERTINQLRRKLWNQHLDQLTDPEEINDALDETKSDNAVRMIIEERLVEITSDKQELLDLAGDETYLSELARIKLDNLLTQERTQAAKVEEIAEHSDYFESPSLQEDAWETRIAELVTTPEEADEYQFTSGSYALYKLAQKFYSQIKKPVEHQPIITTAPLVSSVADTNETERISALERKTQELQNNDREVRRRIDWSETVESAMHLCRAMPTGSEYRIIAYKRAADLLDTELREVKNSHEAIKLLYFFPKNSSEWAKIAKRLGDFYEKPWYQFW